MEIETYLACINSTMTTTTTTTTTTIPRDCMFGMYAYGDSSNSYIVDNGWRLLSFDELNDLKLEFIDYYNNNNGIPSLLTWDAEVCCFIFDYGIALTIGNTSQPMCSANVVFYGCTPEFNYLKNATYGMARNVHSDFDCLLTLNRADVWNASEIDGCANSHYIPAIYVKNC